MNSKSFFSLSLWVLINLSLLDLEDVPRILAYLAVFDLGKVFNL